MTITVQSRAPGSKEWSTRNAFVTENKQMDIGSMRREDLLARANETLVNWSAYQDGHQLRVYDSKAA